MFRKVHRRGDLKMKILIYDDNENDTFSVIKLIDNYFLNKRINYEIVECTSTPSLFERINNCDLIFLDIEINEENGIEIGKEIRKRNSNVQIIIISNYSKYLIDGYKIQADRYFLKPIKHDEFNIEFENVIDHYLREYNGIFDKKIHKKKIYYKDIIYVEFIERKTKIHLSNSKEIITPYPLKYWEDVLKEENFFAKPHKSFIINFQYISGFSKTDIILITAETIPLSRHYKQSFDESYLDFLQREL